VLHDAVLQHFFLGALPEEYYVEEFVYNYGEWSRELARDLWRNRARSGQDPRYFRYPMLRRLGEVARAVVVHNPAAKRIVKTHAPGANIIEIPHLFEKPAPADPIEVTRLRDRLGLRPSASLFGVFGYLRESKRLSSILRAFETVRRGPSQVALLIAGRFASTDLERATAPLMGAPGVVRVGYLPEPDFQLHAAATDVCINLRCPPAGETSGIAIRMMGIGKPVLLTDGEAVSRYPEPACVRIEAGPGEVEALAAMMLWLAEDAAARREIGRRAAAHIADHHSVECCADKYLKVLESVPHERAPRNRSIRAR
jgi:glycosyltransferase involved in cell wall biosynthesis